MTQTDTKLVFVADLVRAMRSYYLAALSMSERGLTHESAEAQAVADGLAGRISDLLGYDVR